MLFRRQTSEPTASIGKNADVAQASNSGVLATWYTRIKRRHTLAPRSLLKRTLVHLSPRDARSFLSYRFISRRSTTAVCPICARKDETRRTRVYTVYTVCPISSSISDPYVVNVEKTPERYDLDSAGKGIFFPFSRSGFIREQRHLFGIFAVCFSLFVDITNLFSSIFQLPVVDPFLEKVSLSDLGKLHKLHRRSPPLLFSFYPSNRADGFQ